MPQVLKEEVRAKIERAALQEFYDKGFKFATMKGIASSAGIPTGLIYSYFKNKEDLFAHIVRPVCLLLEAIMSHRPVDVEDHLFEYELPQLMKCVNFYHKQMIILIDKSAGSSFEGLKDQMTDEIAVHLKNSSRLNITQYDPIFYHILANNFLESVFEISRHYVDEQWAETMLNLMVKQFIYGIQGIIE